MTKVVEFDGRSSIESQAREWLIRLDGDRPLTRAEVSALRKWMDRSPAHRAELKRISAFWNQANVLTELAVRLEGAAPRNDRGRRALWPRIAVAACALLASVILIPRWLARSDETANGIYHTTVGEQRTVTLPDGSNIRLNTASEVEVAYTRRERKIRLVGGEALFSAAHDASRAFDVYAAGGVVRAIGTAFCVHLDGTRVEVTVAKGVVAIGRSEDGGSARDLTSPIQPPQTLARLEAGQTTSFSEADHDIAVQPISQSELQRRLAWQDGYLAFSGQPLSEVIEQINRYSTVTVEVDDPKLAALAIGGRFKVGDVDAILDVLHTNFGIHSVRLDEHHIRLESSSSRP